MVIRIMSLYGPKLMYSYSCSIFLRQTPNRTMDPRKEGQGLPFRSLRVFGETLGFRVLGFLGL